MELCNRYKSYFNILFFSKTILIERTKINLSDKKDWPHVPSNWAYGPY